MTNEKDLIAGNVVNMFGELLAEMRSWKEEGVPNEKCFAFVKQWLSDWTQILPDDDVPFVWEDVKASLTLTIRNKQIVLDAFTHFPELA